MSDPIHFDTTTARHAFPMLAAGQAQKEFYVNEALARIDALLHPVVEGEAADPPPQPEKGDCWLVGSPASADWLGREDQIASWDGAQWTFMPPVPGMHVHDRTAGERLCFQQSWNRASRPAAPSGGTVVDGEARAAIGSLIDLLATLAIIPQE